MSLRTIRRIVTGVPATDGAGVRLVRVIGHSDVQDFDPFLMLDAFDSTNAADYTRGFPMHPHRGIETVTYLINGAIEHTDSLGSKGVIQDGCCQWMTAGRGILHQEMPAPTPRMWGVQLWLNLPRKDKMTVPQYRDLTAEAIPVVQEEGATVRIVSGNYQDQVGPIQGDYVPTLYLDVDLAPGQTWSLTNEPTNTLFVYILSGSGTFADQAEPAINTRHAVLFSEGNSFRVHAGEKGIRFLLLSAKPLKEPVAWGGPIVMNTREELLQAFRELEQGTFIR